MTRGVLGWASGGLPIPKSGSPDSHQLDRWHSKHVATGAPNMFYRAIRVAGYFPVQNAWKLLHVDCTIFVAAEHLV